MKGLGIYKGLGDPVAKEDSEYPDWLWDLAEEGMAVGRQDSPIRAMRRELNKQNRDSIRSVPLPPSLPRNLFSQRVGRASNFLKNKRK